MKENFTNTLEKYERLNHFVLKGQLLFFGSTFLEEFPLEELKQDFSLDKVIYNRSIQGLTVGEAFKVLEPCVFELMPSKLFLSLGDEDAKLPDFNEKDFLETYAQLLDQISAELPACKIYILSPGYNFALKTLAREKQASYIDLSANNETDYVSAFRRIKRFFRDGSIGFGEAWNV